MSDLIEELREAGKLPEGWDDNEPIDVEWVRQEFGATSVKLSNGDNVDGSWKVIYHRTGGCYGARDMDVGYYTDMEIRTQYRISVK